MVGYDLNGNIHELLRAGKHNDGTYKMTDALIYSYNGNQIHSIQDAGGALVYDGSFDFKPSGSTEAYRFNANGAMTYDPNKGITINYSDWGSPSSITFDSGNSTEYIYGADGRKLKVSWSSNSAHCKPTSRFYDDEEEPGSGSGGNTGGGSQGSTTGNIVSNSMEYVGPFIIIEDSLSRIRFDGGYCTVNGNQAEYHYYVKDHLGSNRLVVDENGNVEQKTYYYPFGGIYGDVSTNTDVQSYKYNGKELDHRHGLDLYDYGARMYDAAIGSWTTMDPLAEKYYNVSPYAYCMGNPIRYVDIYGLFPTGIITVHYSRTHVATSSSVTGIIMTTEKQMTYYNFTRSAAHLLSLVSGVSEEDIRNVRLEEFGGQPKNNCITLGSRPENTRMLVSPAYFDESKKNIKQYYDWWFDEFSHEVGHIRQIERDQSLGKYVLKTIYGYVKTMSHDKAPREEEAEEGSIVFGDFKNFVKKEFKTDLTKLFIGKESEEYKINQLDNWWNSYKKQGK